MASVYALVVAAGRGSRFGGAVPKQYFALGGATVLYHAVSALAEHPRISNVLVVIRPEDRGLFDRAIAGLPVLTPVAGGATRQDSVRLGLEALVVYRPEQVIIHDGARPFPDAALVDRVIDGLGRAP
ncbi:MAG TPA: 2-C-methyl-D-erythritol 4-phosphate cytidylyltransferase, partial [Stellaceae bacterium]|nr:2-C-methyl-D-erythritol 4-phosphate cytidylyltransferase [Stellaceae bacterium]